MKSLLVTLTLALVCLIPGQGQTTAEQQSSTAPVWTEADRKYLLDNLIRAKQDLIAETKSLSKKQWNFKETPNRWSINQIVEHLCLWELIQMNEIAVALRIGPVPDFKHYLPDSAFINKDPNRLKKNITTD